MPRDIFVYGFNTRNTEHLQVRYLAGCAMHCTLASQPVEAEELPFYVKGQVQT